MIRMLAASVAAIWFALFGVALAGEQTADQFVQAIYAHYHGTPEKAPGIMLDKDSDIRRYFEPSLANLIIADDNAAAKRNDVPTLDGDAFIDAQDWDISAMQVSTTMAGPDKATAVVRFKNFGEAKVLHLALVRLPAGWRIADITYPGTEGTLRGLYKKR